MTNKQAYPFFIALIGILISIIVTALVINYFFYNPLKYRYEAQSRELKQLKDYFENPKNEDRIFIDWHGFLKLYTKRDNSLHYFFYDSEAMAFRELKILKKKDSPASIALTERIILSNGDTTNIFEFFDLEDVKTKIVKELY